MLGELAYNEATASLHVRFLKPLHCPGREVRCWIRVEGEVVLRCLHVEFCVAHCVPRMRHVLIARVRVEDEECGRLPSALNISAFLSISHAHYHTVHTQY